MYLCTPTGRSKNIGSTLEKCWKDCKSIDCLYTPTRANSIGKRLLTLDSSFRPIESLWTRKRLKQSRNGHDQNLSKTSNLSSDSRTSIGNSWKDTHRSRHHWLKQPRRRIRDSPRLRKCNRHSITSEWCSQQLQCFSCSIRIWKRESRPTPRTTRLEHA